MKSTIKVFLGEHPRAIGVLRYNADGARESAAFEYDSNWLAAPDRFSMDPTLQLVPGAQFHKKTFEHPERDAARGRKRRSKTR